MAHTYRYKPARNQPRTMSNTLVFFCVIPRDTTRTGTRKMKLQRQAASFC